MLGNLPTLAGRPKIAGELASLTRFKQWGSAAFTAGQLKTIVGEQLRKKPHALRHTFAMDLYRETKNIRLVQKALGHSDLSTTMIYTHIVDEELEEALKGFRQATGK